MTASEAIEILKRMNVPPAHPLNVAGRKAIEALEKKIAKKVVPVQRTAHDFETGVCKHSHFPCEHLKPYYREYKYTDYKCPVCDKLTKDGTPSFCWNCGQALDWSDTE